MHAHDDTSQLQNRPAPPLSLARWRHALRSPLNAILTAAAVLETCPADSAAAVEARRIIARQTRNLAWLISDMR
jgi:signal transduction histidine kinase